MNYYALLISLLMLQTAQGNNNATDPNIYVVNVNDNSQKIFIEKKQSKMTCEKCCGEKLVACYFSLIVADQRKVFGQLPANKRREMLRNFTLPDYENFLKAYNDEEEWKELLKALTEDEQEYWPQTVTEQLELLENLKSKVDKVSDVFNIGGDILLSTLNPVFILLPVYKAYHIIRYNENPLKKNLADREFKLYMEATFEL